MPPRRGESWGEGMRCGERFLAAPFLLQREPRTAGTGTAEEGKENKKKKRDKKKKRRKVEVEEGGFTSLLLCSLLPLSLQSCLRDEEEADVCSGLVTRAKRSCSCSPGAVPKGWKTLWDLMAPLWQSQAKGPSAYL